MKYKSLIIGILISLTLMSCNCKVLVDGKVVDSNTKEPIKKAWVEFTNVKCTEKVSSTVATKMVNCVFASDSSGVFLMKSNSYGICPDNPIKIKIRKPGYKTKEINLNNGYLISDLLVELEKE